MSASEADSARPPAAGPSGGAARGSAAARGSTARTSASIPPDGPAGNPAGGLAQARTGSYGRGARILSVGIAATGLLTLAYFSISSHVLGEDAASRIALLWSIMFVITSVIYRPTEQLLSRTIAERRARGGAQHPLRVPLAIQAGFALAFLIAALALRGELAGHVFDHYTALYDVLVVGTLAYAASYFARGWLAGHQYFALFGGLVLLESFSRLCFALAVALGIAGGQTTVALGIAAAPLVSLVVIPWAFLRRSREQHTPAGQATLAGRTTLAGGATLTDGPPAPGGQRLTPAGRPAAGALSLRRGTGFAGWVAGIMLSEQTILNAAVLTIAATSAHQALVGIVFDVLLIARAPLQLFQAIQTSLLPHLTGLDATEGHQAFARAVRITILAIAAFGGAVALGLLAVGPLVMSHLFGQHYSYGRVGLALVGLGMGMHLVSGTLNQAALARDHARAAAFCWLTAAGAFVVWMLLPLASDELLRAETGYLGATSLLALGLGAVYRRGSRSPLRAQAAPMASTIAR